MTVESKGRDLFIVDNSVSGWTGLRYLEEWASIAKAFDIATGYFEIGALLALDGKWQPLEKMRILMGAEMTHRTRKALLEAVRSRAVEIDEVIEAHGGWPEAFQTGEAKAAMAKVIPFRPRVVQPRPEERYATCVPLVPLKAAAGAFSDPQHVEDGS